MAKPIVSRRPAVASLSPHSAEPEQQSGPAASEDPFDDLFRRLLVAVSHVRLVSQHFGDLSSLDPEDVPAGLTLFEAAQDLDALYDDLASWSVRHEHRPKTTKTAEPGVDTSEQPAGDRIDGQRLYDDVADLERQLQSLMDEIPYSSLVDLPESHPTAQAFLNAEIHLQDAVAQLQKVHDVEVPRFEALKGSES